MTTIVSGYSWRGLKTRWQTFRRMKNWKDRWTALTKPITVIPLEGETYRVGQLFKIDV